MIPFHAPEVCVLAYTRKSMPGLLSAGPAPIIAAPLSHVATQRGKPDR
mgnify:FL=1